VGYENDVEQMSFQTGPEDSHKGVEVTLNTSPPHLCGCSRLWQTVPDTSNLCQYIIDVTVSCMYYEI